MNQSKYNKSKECLFDIKKPIFLEIMSDTHFERSTTENMIFFLDKYTNMESIYWKEIVDQSNIINTCCNCINEKKTLPYNNIYKFLCASGDICSIEQLEVFLDYVTIRYDYVFYVPGNHEYYFHDMCQVNDILRRLNKEYKNLTIFVPELYYVFVYDDLIFFGNTLWTLSNCNSYKSMLELNTYNNITINNKLLTPHNTDILYCRAIKKLEKVLSWNIKTVVMTHHAPSYNVSNIRYPGFQEGYVSDLNDIICYPILTWIYGHNNANILTMVNNVMLCSNVWDFERNYVNKFTIIYDFFNIEHSTCNHK